MLLMGEDQVGLYLSTRDSVHFRWGLYSYFVAEFVGRGYYLHSLVLMVSEHSCRHLASFFNYFLFGRGHYITIYILEHLVMVSFKFVINWTSSSSSCCS